ncbi:MAG TPA: hypothetical protein VNY27_05130 [Solirubrobacteraceae bacterium]|jgi:hypothetical protein|nr:hypothetical protein [Solirubrobacteraceae bacterium]
MSFEQGPAGEDAAPAHPSPDASEGVSLAPRSLGGHLARGALGFGLVGAAFALTPSLGAPALLLAPPGLVALGGCPTCWIAGLLERISAGRLQRTCADEGCELRARPASHVRPSLHSRPTPHARPSSHSRPTPHARPSSTTNGALPHVGH